MMRLPEPISAERFAELNNFRKEKWPGFEFQRFLCIWLRVECGLSTDAMASSSELSTVDFGCLGPIGESLT